MSSLFSMEGRYNRAKYFWTEFGIFVFWVVLSNVLELVVPKLGGDFNTAPRLFFLISIPIAVIAVFQVVKRLHDLGRPGSHWWLLLIPLYNIYFGFVLLFQKGSEGENQSGPKQVENQEGELEPTGKTATQKETPKIKQVLRRPPIQDEHVDVNFPAKNKVLTPDEIKLSQIKREYDPKGQSAHRVMGVTVCPNCKTRVLPKSDGTCPSCQSIIPQKEKGLISKSIEPIKNSEASIYLKQEPSSMPKIKSTTKVIDKRRASPGSSLGSKNVAAESTQSTKPKQKLRSQSTPLVSPDQQQAISDPKDTLVRGLFRVDLGHFLGQQEIHITLLKRAAEGDYEREIVKSISESGARHILIAGILASAVFSDVHSDFISLPNGKYSFAFRYVPSDSQNRVLKDFAELRKTEPNQNHILVCPTHPETVSGCGIFDHLPKATDGAAVYVIGYGSRYSNLVANFYRCVNVPGKAKGFVHSIVSLYDSTRIVNEDFDKLQSITNPVEKLRYFWGMEGLRYEPPPMPTLLGITAA